MVAEAAIVDPVNERFLAADSPDILKPFWHDMSANPNQ